MPGKSDRDLFIDAVRSVAGEDAVDRLYRERGGAEHRLPNNAFIGNWLVELIGLEKAQQVIDRCKIYDADGNVAEFRVYVPIGRYSAREMKRQEAVALSAQGYTVRTVAQKIGVSERTASRMIGGIFTKQRIEKKSKSLRIGLLELFILEGRPDSMISGRLGVNRKEIAMRRHSLRSAGMLDGSTLQRAQDYLRKIGEATAAPPEDPPADIGVPFLPTGEVI